MKSCIVEIYNQEYRFELVPTRSSELMSGSVINYGSHSYCEGRIIIDEGLPMRQKIQTLRHEIVHAIVDFLGIQKDAFTEEDLCEFVAIHVTEIERVTKEVKRLWGDETQ